MDEPVVAGDEQIEVVGVAGDGGRRMDGYVARVLELFSRDGFKPLYFFLCHSLGLQHDFLCGDAGNRREDFSVDLDDLKRSVETMLAATASD